MRNGINDTDLVISRLLDDAAASYSEFILVAVDDFRVGSRRADEADAFGVGGQFDSTFAGNCIRRIKDGGAGNRPEHRDVLQRHLRWTVLADRNAGMTACRGTKEEIKNVRKKNKQTNKETNK